MGSILRASGCYGVETIYYTGNRYAMATRFATDTQKQSESIPCHRCTDLLAVKPASSALVAVELVEGACPLPEFIHPEQAYYIFGPEDGSLPQSVVNHCDHVVYIPTHGCMNLAATVNVLLYDRMAKAEYTEYGDHIIRQSRDNNNRTRVKNKAASGA